MDIIELFYTMCVCVCVGRHSVFGVVCLMPSVRVFVCVCLLKGFPVSGLNGPQGLLYVPPGVLALSFPAGGDRGGRGEAREKSEAVGCRLSQP